MTMRHVSLKGKTEYVNFDLNIATYSPTTTKNFNHHHRHQQLKTTTTTTPAASATNRISSSTPITEQHQQQEKEEEKESIVKYQKQKKLHSFEEDNDDEEEKEGEMPAQRKVRNVEQRRKMKIHNRKDDIPDCDTLEIIEFDENCNDPSFFVPSAESDASTTGSHRSSKSKKPLKYSRLSATQLDPEVNVSLTNADQSYQSCDGSTNGRTSSAASTSAATGSTSFSTRTHGTRRRRGHRRHKRHQTEEPPSPLMKFLQSFVENFGQALYDLFVFLCSFVQIDGNNTSPASFFLLLVGIYFVISYIEVSFAGTIELLIEWSWPIIHVSLRMIEKGYKNIGNLIAGVDDVAEGSYCDMASMWCDYFDLMCSSRCSFTKFALERFRH